MAFYVQQGLTDFTFKMGKALDYRVFTRMREHETRGGPQRRIGTAPHWGDEEEHWILDNVSEHRLTSPDRKRPYEVVACVPKVIRLLCGAALADQGFVLEQKPLSPTKETCAEWQQRIARIRGRRTFVGRAALHNVDTDARVRELVNPEHSGGWTLADSVAGKTGWAPRRFEISGKQKDWLHELGLESSIFSEGNHLVCELKAKGRSFKFFVFAEAQDRMGMKRHPHALIAGHPWGEPRLPGSPRKPLPRSGASAQAIRDPRQAELFE